MAGVAACAVLVVLAAPALFVAMRLYFQAASPLLAMLLTDGLLAGDHYRQAAARVRAVSAAFSRYLSPDVVADIARSGEIPELGGQLQTVTVLFCDMRGFTPIARKLPPTELVAMLSAFFEAISRPVLAHRGFLGKFVGDQVMAVFGLPYPQADDARRAVQAALEMRTALRQFNEASVPQGWPAVSVGIGVHCGQAVVGNVGWEGRMDYTAMGDTVVLAQRLQAASKDLGVDIVVGTEVAQQLPPEFRVRLLGEVHPSGWDQAVPAYALE